MTDEFGLRARANLGEDGLYAHSRINHPELREVPWLVVKKDN